MKLIDKTIACSLHQFLIERSAFSDYHDLPSYEGALNVLRDAGIGAILLPNRKGPRTKQWDVSLAIVPAEAGDIFKLNGDPAKKFTKVYALVDLHPMTEYVGELMTCSLMDPWWAVPSFFSKLTHVLAPGYSTDSCYQGGRSGWGHQLRNAFDRRFRELWIDAEQEPQPLEPKLAINPKLIRFTRFHVLPFAPAQAGE